MRLFYKFDKIFSKKRASSVVFSTSRTGPIYNTCASRMFSGIFFRLCSLRYAQGYKAGSIWFKEGLFQGRLIQRKLIYGRRTFLPCIFHHQIGRLTSGIVKKWPFLTIFLKKKISKKLPKMAILLVNLAHFLKSVFTILGPIFGSQKDPKIGHTMRIIPRTKTSRIPSKV